MSSAPRAVVQQEIPQTWISTLRYFPTNTSSFAVNGTVSGNPVQLFSTLRFPTAGWYNVGMDATFVRLTGSTGTQDTHACIGISSITETKFSALPFINENGSSTFTTLNMTTNVTSNALTRNLVYMDKSVNTYTGVVNLGNPRIQFIPTL
jgi:hypothetical protein